MRITSNRQKQYNKINLEYGGGGWPKNVTGDREAGVGELSQDHNGHRVIFWNYLIAVIVALCFPYTMAAVRFPSGLVDAQRAKGGREVWMLDD